MVHFLTENKSNKEFTTSDAFKNFKKQYYLIMSNLSLVYTQLKKYNESISLDLEVIFFNVFF